jgi:nuclear pore complex protein Nup85
MTEPSLFAIVPTYFTSCGDAGHDHLECFLERVPIESEKKALKLLRVCALHQLTRLEQSICRVMGRRAIATRQTGSALAWFTRANDEASVDMITQLANLMLRDYQEARLRGQQPDLQRKVNPHPTHPLRGCVRSRENAMGL